MLGMMEMKVVEGQDYSDVLLITLLYYLLVSSNPYALAKEEAEAAAATQGATCIHV